MFLKQGITLFAMVFSTGVPKLRPQSSMNPLHVNSVSADTCVGIANLIGGWIPNIFKDKPSGAMNSFPELGRWKTNCVSPKLKVFKKAVNNIQKEILNMHVKSIISLWSSVASRQLSCHA